jgi:hypothetical protein
MASIVGEKPKYRNAGGTVLDKIFGYMDESVNIYNKAKSGYVEGGNTPKPPTTGLFGLEKPWGTVIVVTGLAIAGIVIYKIATK